VFSLGSPAIDLTLTRVDHALETLPADRRSGRALLVRRPRSRPDPEPEHQMIPTIGVMIGLYITTRMIDMMITHEAQQTMHPALMLMAVLTSLGAIGGIVLLISQAREADQAMQGLQTLPF
jgi:hypothetical protein